MQIDYEADLATKLSRNAELWKMLAPHAAVGVEFTLDFFFYADSEASSKQLTEELGALGYRTTSTRKSMLRRRWSVTGSTLPMTLTKDGIDDWTRTMNDVARRCASLFDGWGTGFPK